MSAPAGSPRGPCPACGSALSRWREVPGGEPADSRRYPLARCERCGTAVTGGPPPASESYEAGVYAPREPRLAPLVRLLQRPADTQVVRLLRRAGVRARPGTADRGGDAAAARGPKSPATPSRVLDAGAGGGRLVAALRAAGYEAVGIEPSRRGAERARGVQLPVLRESIEHHEDTGLDAVVLWHVLEHLDDPGAALARVRGWLRPGGTVLVGVPNLASWQAGLAGERWFHLDAPRHRTHFTTAGVRELLAGAGFAEVAVRHMVWEHNPAGMWMALLGRLGMTSGFPFHLLKRNVAARPRDLALLALGLPLLLVAFALEAAAATARRGGTIAVVARRQDENERM